MEGSHRRITGAQADPEAEGENRDEGRSEGRTRARRPGVTNLDTGAAKDWVAWHAAYDEDTPLHHRLRAVQGRIREALLDRPPGPIRVISACAGEGRDLLGALVDHPRSSGRDTGARRT